MLPALLLSLMTVPMPPQAARLQVHANHPNILAGEIVQIEWIAVGVEDVWVEPMGQRMPPTGHMILRPEETTTYWFSAVNMAGGESRPVTITVTRSQSGYAETLPPAPVLPSPAAPPVAPPVPSPLPVPPKIDANASGQFWIQVVATTDRSQAEALADSLASRCGERPIVLEVPDPFGKPRNIHRVRFGPFSSLKEAKARMKAREACMKVPGSKPYITAH